MDSKEVSRWIEQATYDLRTAKAMLSARRYLYVFFCCQQALEKIIKAVIIKNTGELPPRIHNLPTLSELASVNLDAADVKLLRELTDVYVKIRYPLEVSVVLSKSNSEKYLMHTQRLFRWLKKGI